MIYDQLVSSSIVPIRKEGNAFSINNIEYSNMNLTTYSIKRPQKLLAETGSTMHRTIKHSPSSSKDKRCSMMFQRPTRDNIRLYSTIKCQQLQKSKFHKISTLNSESFKWNNWKYSGFPIVSESFKKNLKLKLEKTCNQEREKELMEADELKIRHKIREVSKLKEDVAKAQQNNRLIKLIEDAHNGKIKTFFDQLEKDLKK